MANGEFGKIYKKIWGDADFKALTAEQQLQYVKLVSQSDISLAGVLTLAPTRWATQTHDLTVGDIEQSIHDLEAARFVVCDRETQEILVRSYIRNDMLWKSIKTMKAIRGAIERVLSPKLRGVISAELARIDTSVISDKVSETYGQSSRQYVESVIGHLIEESPPLDTPPDTPSDTPSHTPSDTPSDGVFLSSPLATATATAPANANANANAPANAPATSAPTVRARPAPRDPERDDSGAIIGEWIDTLPSRPPGRVIGQVAREVKAMLNEGIDPTLIRTGVTEWQRKGLHPSTLTSVVHEVSTPHQRHETATDRARGWLELDMGSIEPNGIEQ